MLGWFVVILCAIYSRLGCVRTGAPKSGRFTFLVFRIAGQRAVPYPVGRLSVRRTQQSLTFTGKMHTTPFFPPSHITESTDCTLLGFASQSCPLVSRSSQFFDSRFFNAARSPHERSSGALGARRGGSFMFYALCSKLDRTWA